MLRTKYQYMFNRHINSESQIDEYNSQYIGVLS